LPPDGNMSPSRGTACSGEVGPAGYALTAQLLDGGRILIEDDALMTLAREAVGDGAAYAPRPTMPSCN
jgi:hypothetical protein